MSRTNIQKIIRNKKINYANVYQLLKFETFDLIDSDILLAFS